MENQIVLKIIDIYRTNPIELAFIVFLFFTLTEQLLCLFPGSIPYRYGIIIYKVQIHDFNKWAEISKSQQQGRIEVNLDNKKENLFLSFNYPIGLSPQIVVGHGKKNNNIIKFRIPFFTFVCILVSGIGLLALIIFFIFYRNAYRSLQSMIEQKHITKKLC